MQNPLETFSFTDPFDSWWPFVVAFFIGVITTIRAYIVGPSCSKDESLKNKYVVMTGGTHGLGFEVAIDFLERGATIIVGTRSVDKTRDIFENRLIGKNTGLRQFLKIQYLDLASFAAIHSFYKNIDVSTVDILINNAGIAFNPFQLTEDGIERNLQVNYVGHFLLTHLLLAKLKQSTDGRVINTSAHVHHKANISINNLNLENDYTPSRAFSQSKLAIILFTKYLSNKLKGTNVKINAVNPGLIRGSSHKNNSLLNQSFAFKLMSAPTSWLLMKTPKQAAQTIIHLATSPEFQQVSGRYFSNSADTEPSKEARSSDMARQLHQTTTKMVGIRNFNTSQYQ